MTADDSPPAFDFTPIKVFISSRVEQPLTKDGPTPTLREARQALAAALRKQKLFGEDLFEVDTNETWPSFSGEADTWQRCKLRVKRADIVLVLYSGSSGWRDQYGSLGICHAEMQAAVEAVPQRLRTLTLPKVHAPKRSKREIAADDRFAGYWERAGRHGPPANTVKEVVDRGLATIREAVAELAHEGAKHTAGTQIGERLDWTRFDFASRADAMRKQVRDDLADDPAVLDGKTGPAGSLLASSRFGREAPKDVLVACHAVPAAMTVASARELVGQPFLRDHKLRDHLRGKRVGPVHVIACHRGVTETQAARLLGFPDATILRESFGVYAADDVQKIQLVFLKDCNDPSSTAERVAQLRRWLAVSEEDERLVARAEARRDIVQTIAKYAGAPPTQP